MLRQVLWALAESGARISLLTDDRELIAGVAGTPVAPAYLLARVLEQPRHVQALTTAAARHFHTHHAVGDLVGKLLALYRSVVTGTGTAPAGDVEKSLGNDAP